MLLICHAVDHIKYCCSTFVDNKYPFIYLFILLFFSTLNTYFTGTTTKPMYFDFCRLCPFSPPSNTFKLSTLTNTVSPVRRLAYPYDWRGFVGTQREDERGSLSIQSSLRYTVRSALKKEGKKMGEKPIIL
jgi:hypothetical protein